MMQTRLVPYVLGRQIKQAFINGRWQDTGVHFPNTMSTVLSGSSNDHARKAPSASERWTRCTASIAFEAANADKIFVTALGKVRDLADYLRTLGDELHDNEVRALAIIDALDAGKLKVSKLTPEQKKDILDSEGSFASREGTRAHDFAAQVFAGTRKIEDLPEGFQLGVRQYIEHCMALVDADTEHYVEVEVPLWYSPGDSGTSDFVAIRQSDPPVVFGRDLKWGSGVLVHNIENPQFAIYIRSVVEQWGEDGFMSFPPDTVINIGAFQPNHREAADIKPWITTLADLRTFTAEIEEKAAEIDSGKDLVFEPSDEAWCRSFCPCKGFCEARLKFATEAWENPNTLASAAELLSLLPNDDEIPGHKPRTKTALTKLDPVERSEKRVQYVANLAGEDIGWTLDWKTIVGLWAKKKIITSILDDFSELLRDAMLAGDPEVAEYLKLVESKEGNRAWVSEEAAEKLLKQRLKIDDYKPRSLISVTEAQKLIDLEKEKTKFKNLFNGLITRSAAGKTIALLSDKRPAVVNAIDLLPDDDEPMSFDEVITSTIVAVDAEDDDDGFGDCGNE